MKCPNCNSIIPDDSKFCPDCGISVSVVKTYSPEDYLYPHKKNEKWGYVNSKGRVVIPYIYDDADNFYDGLACVKSDDHWQYIDKQGEIVLPYLFRYPRHFHEGLLCNWIIDENEVFFYVIINKKGKIIYKRESNGYDEIVHGYYSESLCPKQAGRNCAGFIDTNARFVIPPIYEDCHSFSCGLAAVESEGKWGYIDALGNLVIDFLFDFADCFNDGWAAVKIGDKFYRIDPSGDIIDDKINGNERGVTEGVFPYMDTSNNKWGYKNSESMLVEIPANFDDAFCFHHGLALVELNGGWHLINHKGEVVIW